MFTGIIEEIGAIESMTVAGTNVTFKIRAAMAPQLKQDQSLSHNGICLTVENIDGDLYTVTAIAETLNKTDAGSWQIGTKVNLERCLQMNGRLDGHLVQGHADGTAVCVAKEDRNGSWEFRFRIDPKFSGLIIEKGSITLNGISLTIFDVSADQFTVGIIPYTFNRTNMQFVRPGDAVNVEFDMIGKYINRMQYVRSNLTKPVLDA